MRFANGLFKSFDADMGVNLGCRQALMPEQLLNRFQVRAAVQKVGGKAMAESMGTRFGRESDT